MNFKRALYRVEQVRALDQAAMTAGIAGFDLMQRAATAAWALLRQRWRWAREVVVLAGAGNNGGDGLVLAALAARAGWPVRVFKAFDPQRLQGDARKAYELARAEQVSMQDWDGQSLQADAVLVDALLGTGLRGQVRSPQTEIIRWAHEQTCPCLALDVPSGLDADRGQVQGEAVRAQMTLTFVADKPGLHTAEGPQHAGEVRLADLEIPTQLREAFEPAAFLLPESLPTAMPERSRNSHKGQFGHVLCVGGNRGMAGAIRLCGEAALRSGAGLVSLRCHPDSAVLAGSGRPELMVQGTRQGWNAAGHTTATVLAIGPGLGRDAWAAAQLEAAWQDARPLVVDADALYGLPEQGLGERSLVLTPHPGEAAHLLSCPVAEVQADRLQAATELATRFNAVVVLKGAGTVIAAPGTTSVIAPWSLPAMSGAGFGDVLTGMIAALMAQGLSPWQAACNAVVAHGLAARKTAGTRSRGLMAGDLCACLPEVLS